MKQNTLARYRATGKTRLIGFIAAAAVLLLTATAVITASAGLARRTGAAVGTDSPDVKQVVLNIGEDESRRNLVWYGKSALAGEAQVALASGFNGQNFPVTYQTFAASRTASASSAQSGFGVYRATADGLAADTAYIYRVGNEDKGWSAIYTFRTGDYGKGFSFLAAGDPQIGADGGGSQTKIDADTVKWQQTLTHAKNWFGDKIDFMITLGDQVESNNNVARSESEYTAFLSPDYLREVALAANIGNHDVTQNTYNEHYNMPNVSTTRGVSSNVGGDNWYSYNGVLFMSLNSNVQTNSQHVTFIEETIEAYKAAHGGAGPLWKVVTFHHGLYSSASHTTDTDIRTRRVELSPEFSRLGIDAVLAGHDHVYTRAYMMSGALMGSGTGRGMTPVTTGYGGGAALSSYTKQSAGETFYLECNSASGSKHYALKNTDYAFVAKQNQESVPNITKVDVTANAMTFTTYRTGANNKASEVIDTFTLYRGDAAPATAPESVATGEINKAFSYQLEAAGAAVGWSVQTGSLPTGLSLNAETGVISGTPAVSGIFNVVLYAANENGVAVKSLSIILIRQGADGQDGQDGDKGDKGDTGAKGDKGETGDKGDTGAKGDKGETGDKGDKGDTGADGAKGDKGDTGAKGTDGTNGTDGSDGEKGATGAKGDKGDKGDTGAAGAAGCGSIGGAGSGFGGGVGGTAAMIAALPLIGLLFTVARRVRKNKETSNGANA
ncbi:hypothetical protein FACS1894211_11060 [Clostridia bacterium]|nr:hypothetical protein FACS1894211_11060 [Clostridia bacterium]